MTSGVNPPDSWGPGSGHTPAIPLVERTGEFRQTLLGRPVIGDLDAPRDSFGHKAVMPSTAACRIARGAEE